MKRITLVLGLALLLLLALATPALAADGPFVFKTTNDQNRANNLPHVDVVKVNPTHIWLEFINPTPYLFYFEYRIDGQVLTSGIPHPLLAGDWEYPGVNLDGRTAANLPVTKTVKFKANEMIEVRLALGAENDWYFDWTPFEVASKP
jgi:hypothetical protein